MDKTPPKDPKKGNKTKTKQPLKVVYITNPIKFTTTASEFRALVQELTGQDADVSDSIRLSAAHGGGPAPGDSVHAVVEEQVEGKMGQSEWLRNGSDLSTFGSYEEVDEDSVFYSKEMMEGLASSDSMWHQEYSNVDVFKRLDAAAM